MKRLYYAILALAMFSLLPSKLNAQCNGCQISLPTLSVDTIYMDSIPIAGVNTVYEEAISFRFPHTTNSMSSFGVPSGISINSVQLNNITGLPAGMTYTFGQSPALYNQTLPTPRDGCFTICGTPSDTGTSAVFLNCTVNVQFIGAMPIAIPLQMKVACAHTSSSFTITACDSFVSPSGKVWTNSNTYMDTIPNSASCDSIITLNLTITNIDSSVTQNGLLLQASDNSVDSVQWHNCSPWNPIPAAQLQSFVPSSNGTYAVVLFKNGCSDTSECLTVTGIGINNPLANVVRIYPNPSNGQFRADLGSHYERIQITVTDISGKSIAKHNFTSTQQLEFMLHEKPGIYFVQIEADGFRTVSRVILK